MEGIEVGKITGVFSFLLTVGFIILNSKIIFINNNYKIENQLT